MTGDALDDRVRTALRQHPAIGSVALVGSRSRGEETPYSDWDFLVDVTDFADVSQALPSLVRPLEPVALQWDPLSGHHVYALLLPGPTKVDLLFDEPHEPGQPWTVGPETLAAIDSHLWDWTWWLVGKRHRGDAAFVDSELRKLHHYLLRPAGTLQAPATIEDAVTSWLTQRGELETRYGCRVPRAVEEAVLPALRRASGS